MYNNEQQQEWHQRTEAMLQLLKQEAINDSHQAPVLRDLLRYHDWRYYVRSEPIITDFDYDQLFKALEAIERAHPECITADSPTQRIAKSLTDDFPAVAHLAAMLSLENSYNAGDIAEFERRVQELVQGETVAYCIEPKFDGSSIALVYEDDVLVRAATRGDGTIGEEITHNARALHSIPLRAPFSKHGISKIEIRGEVIIRKEVFERMNTQRKALGLKPFQNPRNTASGSLRLKDPREAADRGLEAVLYHVSFAVDATGNNVLGKQFQTHAGMIELLQQCGFVTPWRELKLCNTHDEVVAFLATWEQKRYTFPIETDGMVIKVNQLLQQQKCGSTSHHPRWAIAYKFPARQAQSRLLEVDYQVGRTGAITPVAKIEPVALSGVTISSISLHNADFIAEKDLRIGDTVIVERAGEVIPYIVGMVPDLRNGSEQPISFPQNCPSCSNQLIKPEEEAVWRCDNAECPAQSEERIIHYVSKDAMDIEGLGRSIIIDFVQRGYLHSIADIYALPFHEISSLEGWGEKSIENLKNGIAQSKDRPLWRLLTALGVRHVGVTTAKDVSKHIHSIFDLENMDTDQLMHIEGIGPKVAASIHDFFQQEGNRHLLRTLEQAGVNVVIREQDVQTQSLKLQGKTFLFTGTLAQFTRDRAKQLVEEHGGKLLSGVSAKLDYLVAGAEAGSKLTKARTIPSISILTEDEFLALLAD
ncbi:MAG: NAD-dependent DNA ligase LigA [Chitinophagales bacterium]